MVATKVNEDLQKERKKCSFNVEELTNFLDGGAKITTSRRNLESKLLSVKGLRDEIPEEFLSHKEKYENAIRKAVMYTNTMSELYDPSKNVMERSREHYRSVPHMAVFKDNTPFSLHTVMFIPAIMGQASDEQKEYWLERAKKMEIIGTYAQVAQLIHTSRKRPQDAGCIAPLYGNADAQTELGHGTFIRGLETTATYDAATDEFILHSPTVSAYKWWPGSLGHTANYCIVMAQLLINGKACGIQPFMVQIRDEETHMPLPGIKVGEIGAKLGFNTVNNGFLGFDQHRIPRDRMLMKNAQVLKGGKFISSPNNKLTYGTMVYVRVVIVNSMANMLALAATIAVRYAAVRRQSQIMPSEPEVQILDFVTQQHKLLISIATSQAFSFTATWLWDLYSKVSGDLATGNTDELPELHAIACCLKAVTSADAAILVERCRLSCGGHGYILSSNLPQLYGLITAGSTYEGENTVLLLQTARYLVKAWDAAEQGKHLSMTTAYLSDRSQPLKWDGSVEGIIRSSQRVATGKLSSAVSSMRKYIKSGLSPEDAWNKASVQLVAASEAHCRSFLLSTYHAEMSRKAASLSASLEAVLGQLVRLYAVYWALERLGDLLLYTSITANDVTELKHAYEDLLEKIRPNAVGLVDAFDYRDEILNSTLGAFDGRVYERLMEEAMKSPLNQEPVNQSFHKYLKPFMQGKL